MTRDPRMRRDEARVAALDALAAERALAARIHASTGLGSPPDPSATPDRAAIERATFAVVAARSDSELPPAPELWRRLTEIDVYIRNDGLWAYFGQPLLAEPARIRDDFETIGAHAHAAQLDAAIAYFARGDDDPDRLDALERGYLALAATEPLEPLLVAFARTREHEFFVD